MRDSVVPKMSSPPKMSVGRILPSGKTCTLVVLLFLNLAVTEEVDEVSPLVNVIQKVPLYNKYCPLVTDEECPGEYVEFWLYTRCNESNPVKLDIHSLGAAPWVAGCLKILIHGYLGNKDAQINKEFRTAYLATEDCNVVSVDWGTFCRPGCYLTAVENMRAVGRTVSDVITAVVAHGIARACDIHVLGHSLGAHVARIASSSCNFPVGRLSTFDPARPFISEEDTAPGKAEFMAVYHSNSGILGQRKPSGHVDVYLNNGVHQPGCGFDIACSHSRCLSYFAESILCRRPMRAIPCDCEQSDDDGGCLVPEPSYVECPEDAVNVGEHIDTKMKGSFRAFTRAEPPYLLVKYVYDYIRKHHQDPCVFDDMVDAAEDCLKGMDDCMDDIP